MFCIESACIRNMHVATQEVLDLLTLLEQSSVLNILLHLSICCKFKDTIVHTSGPIQSVRRDYKNKIIWVWKCAITPVKADASSLPCSTRPETLSSRRSPYSSSFLLRILHQHVHSAFAQFPPVRNIVNRAYCPQKRYNNAPPVLSRMILSFSCMQPPQTSHASIVIKHAFAAPLVLSKLHPLHGCMDQRSAGDVKASLTSCSHFRSADDVKASLTSCSHF
jgi:hypothetical protein